MRGMLGRVNLGFLLVVTVIVSACASLRPYDPGPGKRVAAFFPKDIYRLGEPVNVTIANLSDISLFYPNNFCKAKLQKMSGASWTTVSEPKGGGCPVALGFLDPGQTVVHSFRLPEDVGGGTYRFAMPMPVPDDSTAAEPEFVTPAFKIADTPQR